MRKDYIENEESEASEAEFVERYWTDKFSQNVDLEKRIIRIGRQDEYLKMKKYLCPNNNSSLLDVGCGLGDWVMFLERLGHRVTGMDISEKLISKLKNVYPAGKFLNEDIRRTSIGNDVYDGCYSWGVFEHFEEGPRTCLREAFRVLKPGGLLFASVPHQNWRISTRATFEGYDEGLGSKRFYQYRFTRAEWAREILKAGFDIIDMELIHKPQGVMRCLHHEFGFPYEWVLTRGVAGLVSPILPASWFAHMVMGIAKKPGDRIDQ